MQCNIHMQRSRCNQRESYNILCACFFGSLPGLPAGTTYCLLVRTTRPQSWLLYVFYGGVDPTTSPSSVYITCKVVAPHFFKQSKLTDLAVHQALSTTLIHPSSAIHSQQLIIWLLLSLLTCTSLDLTPPASGAISSSTTTHALHHRFNYG